MTQEGPFPHASVEGVQLLELPYRQGELAMLIALPDPDRDLAQAKPRFPPSCSNSGAALCARRT